ncbi:hypothetical protein [Marinobacter sp.]|uniref:hypothetical protein n=1 Tax=Marinobacter sp. TaxID=50741 RepID=UPI00384FA18D
MPGFSVACGRAFYIRAVKESESLCPDQTRQNQWTGAISEAGIRARDRQVLSELLGWGIPVATVIGGGYDNDRAALARRHAIVIEEASRLWLERSRGSS